MSADCCMRAWVCGGGQRDVGGRGSDGYVCASDVWASCVHVVCACRCGLPHRRRGPRAFIAAGCWRVRVGRPAISRPVRSAPLGGASSSWWRGLGRARSPSSCCSWWSCSSDVCDGPSYPGTHLRCELCSGASGGGEPGIEWSLRDGCVVDALCVSFLSFLSCCRDTDLLHVPPFKRP